MRTDRLLLGLLGALALVGVLLGLGLGSDENPARLPSAAPEGSPPPTSMPRKAAVEPGESSREGATSAVENETAALELRFACADPRQVEGIVLRLVKIEGERLSRPVAFLTTGPEGVALFEGLDPGSYRWLHDGSRAIVPVPLNEQAAVATEGERVVLRPGEGLRSGLIRLEAGDHRRLLVPLSVGATVSGRVVDDAGLLGRAVALKLISRERFVHPAGTEVERIVARQARLFASGEFRFDRVRPGLMELLGYWRDDDGVSQLRLEFELEEGEQRDLGPVPGCAGRTLAIRLRAIDVDGRGLDCTSLFGTSAVQRVVELRPLDPDPDWPYQKIELPQGRLFELRGLPDCELRLTSAREDVRVNPPKSGWTRIGPTEFRIAGDQSGPVELVERWGRIAALRLRLLDAASLAPGRDDWDLHLIGLDGAPSISRRVRAGSGVIELRVPEGRYRVLLGDLVPGAYRQADSGAFRLGVEGRVLDLVSAPAGRVLARISATGRGGPLRIGLPEPGGVLMVEPDAQGRCLIDLPPGRYRLREPQRELLVAADRMHDLGELDDE